MEEKRDRGCRVYMNADECGVQTSRAQIVRVICGADCNSTVIQPTVIYVFNNSNGLDVVVVTGFVVFLARL